MLCIVNYRRTPARSAIQALLPGVIEQLQMAEREPGEVITILVRDVSRR